MIDTELGDLIGRARHARRGMQNLQLWLCALQAKVSAARAILATPAPEDAARAYLRELVEWYDTFKAVVDASPLLTLDIEAFVHGKRASGVGTADDPAVAPARQRQKSRTPPNPGVSNDQNGVIT